MNFTWTAADQRQALRLGWGMFHRIAGREIQKFDEAHRFATNHAARKHVLKLVLTGDALLPETLMAERELARKAITELILKP